MESAARASTSASIDYAPYTARWAADFVGREWVLRRLDAWLARDRPRFFRLTGGPGSGKTALSSRLWQISEGSAEPPAGLPRIGRGLIDAVHFCSGRERLWDDPLAFTRSIALQLADRHPAYAVALAERSGARAVHIDIRQEFGAGAENARGLVIQELHTGGASAEEAFNRLVREPLRALFATGALRHLVILVDALDESLVHTGDAGILALLTQADTLPAGVRFLVTSRPEPEIDQRFAAIPEVDALSLSDPQSRGDVMAYVAHRLRHDRQVAAQAAALGDAATARLVDAIAGRAGDNFLYVRFLLDAVAAGQWSLAELAEPPGAARASGLDALYLLYFESLRRATADVGRRDWATQYAPLMEALSVAQEALTREQLRAFTGQASVPFRENLDDLRQFVGDARLAGGTRTGYRLYHQSFVEFLQAPTLRKDAGDEENRFHLPAADAHARIADHVAQRYAAGWDAPDDAAADGGEGAYQHAYALRHAATHHAGAAAVADPVQRHLRTEALVALVTDAAFQQAHEAQLGDPIALRRDLERAVAATAADGHPSAPPLVVRSALALDALRRAQTRPEDVFACARAGDIDGAERRLALFHAEPAWRQAVLLTAAWLGAATARDAARALRDRVVVAGLEPELHHLAARAGASLDGTAAPPRVAPAHAPSEWQVQEMLQRLGGNATTGIEPLRREYLLAGEGGAGDDAAPAYLADEDGPPLVAFAIASPVSGTEYVQRYIAVHASNEYAFYRNRSLWALIPAVLAHPDEAWVLARLVELGRGALAVTRIHFRETVPLTVLALRAAAGDAAADARLDATTAEARDLAGRMSPVREGDPWAHHLRRLVALAEAHAFARGRTDVADDLLDRAVALPFGFAGFNAVARLTLAELVRLVRPADRALLDRVLGAALASAHNVQDAVLAARATSRVRAIGAWWQAAVPGAPLRTLVSDFAREPGAPPFAARHEIGEAFALRTDHQQRLPIPGWARQARTLGALDRVYDQPATELVRLNARNGWQADDELPPGTVVAVPDPDLAPLHAARLAAEVLAGDEASPARRAALLQRLVPAAASDPTALYVVLSRLLLAARPSDPAVLADLARSVARYVPDELLVPIATPAPGMPA